MVDQLVVNCSTQASQTVTLSPGEATQIAVDISPRVDFLQFIALFTPTEQADIITAAGSNPQILLYCLSAAGAPGGIIHLDDPRVTGGVSALVALGILTSDRATQILAGTPPS
jgi:hypothetical protein